MNALPHYFKFSIVSSFKHPSQYVSLPTLHQTCIIIKKIAAATNKHFVRYLKYCRVLRISRKNFHIVFVCKGKHERTTCNKRLFVCQCYVFTSFDCSNCRLTEQYKVTKSAIFTEKIAHLFGCTILHPFT